MSERSVPAGSRALRGAPRVAVFQHRGAAAEAPLRRHDVPRLLAMAAAGAVRGLMAAGVLTNIKRAL